MSKGGRPQQELILARGVEPRRYVDPGDGGIIPTNQAFYVQLITAGAETRTLPDPQWIGQEFVLSFFFDGGDCTVTADSPINQAGNNTMLFEDVGAYLRLCGHYNPTDGWEWRVIVNDDVTLSTVG